MWVEPDQSLLMDFSTKAKKELLWCVSQSHSCNPVDCGPLCSSVHGFARPEYWSGLLLSPGDLSNLGIGPCLLHWWAGSLPLHCLGSPLLWWVGLKIWVYQCVSCLPHGTHLGKWREIYAWLNSLGLCSQASNTPRLFCYVSPSVPIFLSVLLELGFCQCNCSHICGLFHVNVDLKHFLDWISGCFTTASANRTVLLGDPWLI